MRDNKSVWQKRAGCPLLSVLCVCPPYLKELRREIDQSFYCLFNWQDNDINCPKLDIKFLSYML